MLEYGKILFKSNWTQTFLLFFCFGLAILAKYFSMGTTTLTLHDFLSISFDNVFSQKNDFKIWINVILPFIFYFCAAVLLLWMSISNFFTFQHEKSRLNMSLKLLLAILHALLSVWFFIVGAKLAFYFISFAFTVLLIIGGLIYMFTSRND